MTVYKALKQANVNIGQWVAIAGAGGGLGHLGKAAGIPLLLSLSILFLLQLFNMPLQGDFGFWLLVCWKKILYS